MLLFWVNICTHMLGYCRLTIWSDCNLLWMGIRELVIWLLICLWSTWLRVNFATLHHLVQGGFFIVITRWFRCYLCCFVSCSTMRVFWINQSDIVTFMFVVTAEWPCCIRVHKVGFGVAQRACVHVKKSFIVIWATGNDAHNPALHRMCKAAVWGSMTM